MSSTAPMFGIAGYTIPRNDFHNLKVNVNKWHNVKKVTYIDDAIKLNKWVPASTKYISQEDWNRNPKGKWLKSAR